MSLEQAWQNWIADERAFQQAEPEGRSAFPLTAYRDVAHRALGSVSRAYYDPTRHEIYAAFDYPGVVAHVGAIRVDDGVGPQDCRRQGPGDLYGDVAGVGSGGASALLHDRQRRASRSAGARSRHAPSATLLQKDARIGDLAFNQADKSLWGIRHLNGFCTSSGFPNRTDSGSSCTLPYGTSCTTSTCPRMAATSRRRSERSPASRTFACSRRRR